MLLVILLLKFTHALTSTETNETDNALSRKVIGSSVVTSVSVIVDAGNGSKTYFTDAVGKPMSKPTSGTQLASPINLLNPDRYEFYTFNDSGDLVKRLMTLEEIQGIIASGDGETLNYNSQSLTDNIPEKRVNDVVNNVQNVLKEEMEAHKNVSFTLGMLDTPDVSATWDLILPTIFGNVVDNITPAETSKTEAVVVETTSPAVLITETISIEQKMPLINETGFEIEIDAIPVRDNTTLSVDSMNETKSTKEADNNMTTVSNKPNISTTESLIKTTLRLETTTPTLGTSPVLPVITSTISQTDKVTTGQPTTFFTVTDAIPDNSSTQPSVETISKNAIQESTTPEVTTDSTKISTTPNVVVTTTLTTDSVVTTQNVPLLTTESGKIALISTPTTPTTNFIEESTASLTTSAHLDFSVLVETVQSNSTATLTESTIAATDISANATIPTSTVANLESTTSLETTHEPVTFSTSLPEDQPLLVSSNITDIKNRYEETDFERTTFLATTELVIEPFTTVASLELDSQTTQQTLPLVTSTSNMVSYTTSTASTMQPKIDFRLENEVILNPSITAPPQETTTELFMDTSTEFQYTSTITSTTGSEVYHTNATTEQNIIRNETTTPQQSQSEQTKSTPEFINISATTMKPKTVKPTEQKIISQTQPSTLKPDMTWTLVPTIVPPKITTVNQTTPSQPVDLVPKPLQGFGLEDSTSTLDTDIYQFVELCNELAFGFWSSVTSGISFARSVVVSPFAATSMLAMVFLGARGSTSGEMNEILKLDDMVTFNPHAIFKDVIDSIEMSKKSGVAASVFIKELYSDKGKGKLLRFYKERVKQFYDGYVEEIDFKEIHDIIRRRTNLLVKRHTWGRILEFLKDSSIIARPPLAAISANIFQTDCSAASVEGRDGEIHFVVLPSIRQRKLVPIPAVVWRSGFLAGYDPALDATAVSIGTKEQTISTVFVMPGQQGISAPGDGLARLESRLVANAFRQGAWSRLLRSLIPRPGLEVQMPRFSHKSVINATSALQQMGLKDLFNASTADLKGLNGVPKELYLSDMIQINSFATCSEGRVDETHHSEIYPATANRPLRKVRKLHSYENADDTNVLRDPLYNSEVLALPLQLRPRQARLPEIPRLRFDRPFLFFVRHNPTGLILHIGRFNPRLLP